MVFWIVPFLPVKLVEEIFLWCRLLRVGDKIFPTKLLFFLNAVFFALYLAFGVFFDAVDAFIAGVIISDKVSYPARLLGGPVKQISLMFFLV